MTLATVDIVRLTQAGPTATAITSGTTRASTSDSDSPGANNPIPNSAALNYSYWVTTRLNAVANPDGHTLNNIKWYAATNTVPSGVQIVGNNATSYVQATGTPGVTGTQLTTGNHAGLSGAPVDVFTFTSASPKSLSGSTSSTGQFGDRFVLQVIVDNTTTPQSPAPANTFRWRWDEA